MGREGGSSARVLVALSGHCTQASVGQGTLSPEGHRLPDGCRPLLAGVLPLSAELCKAQEDLDPRSKRHFIQWSIRMMLFENIG